MDRLELVIKPVGSSVSDTQRRVSVGKWKFNDKMMGEQSVTFSVSSEVPIDWAVGDYCIFRGETFTLNYIPAVTQNARSRETGNAFVYENVKFDSFREELTRCQMLDIVGTSDLYDTTMGTNFTGSSNFTLYCGEVVNGSKVSTAVCTLAVKMQANLDRLYNDGHGHGLWSIVVDTAKTHTDDKMLSYNGASVAKALEDVHNIFELDYYIKGREIHIGEVQADITSDDPDDAYEFGYGKGYPTIGNDGTALFQIKKLSDSNQQLVTRLRALGSTKNMPYRYYNKIYGGDASNPMTQSMFPTNLQLPDTFLPETGSSTITHKRPSDPNSKAQGNTRRGSLYRAVKGDTNDSYIDKNDDAASCPEGIREASAKWDGSDSNLQEIFPTIEGVTYQELKDAGVPDQDGNTSGSSYFGGYANSERVDNLLYVDEDANQGSGILPEGGTTDPREYKTVEKRDTHLRYPEAFTYDEDRDEYIGKETTLFTVMNVAAGNYYMAPTNADFVKYIFSIPATIIPGISADVGYVIKVVASNIGTGEETTIATYRSDFVTKSAPIESDIALPALPDVEAETPQVSSITIEGTSHIHVLFTPVLKNVELGEVAQSLDLVYRIGKAASAPVDYTPQYSWCLWGEQGSMTDTFHVYIKDMGFEIQASGSEAPVVSMKTGMCVGRDFEIGDNIQKVEYGGKKGWLLTLNRAKDTSLNIYYPSQDYQLAAGDQFVLLNIVLPDAYIQAAEVRLLKAATDYLTDNEETRYSYQVSLDEIYLQRNYDKAVDKSDSIFWRLYAGMKFPFRGIPTSDGGELPECNITIDSVTISMGESIIPKVEIRLNDDVQQGTLQKLTTAIDRIYNGSIFATPTTGGSGGGMSEARAKNLFISKTSDDTAAGNITFEQNVDVGGSETVDGNLDVGGDIHSDGSTSVGGNASVSGSTSVDGNAVVEGTSSLEGNVTLGGSIGSKDFVSGITGWRMDADGNLEAETIHSRSAIITDELRVNRQQGQEGDTVFSDNDQIIAVEEREEQDHSITYILTLKEKWEGYFTSQQFGNIIRGKINTLAAKDAGVSDYTAAQYEASQGVDNGGNKFYTSYMRVINTHNTAPSMLEQLQIQVSLYGDNDVPMAMNYPPCPLMTIVRAGCWQNPDEAGISSDERNSRIRRQSFFMLSNTDGRIVKLTGVDTPKLRATNFGTTLGKLPEFIENWTIASRLIDGRDYLYAQGVVVGDFIKVDIQGDPIVQYVDCGEWYDGGAQGATPTVGHGIYLLNEHNNTSMQWETHDVWHMGMKWRCMQHQPVMENGVAHYYEPKWNSQYWQFLEGDNNFRMEFASSRGFRFHKNSVSTTITPHLFVGNEEITDEIAATYWSWTRSSDTRTAATIEADEDWDDDHMHMKNLALTDADMPIWWATDNRILFACHVQISDGLTLTFEL